MNRAEYGIDMLLVLLLLTISGAAQDFPAALELPGSAKLTERLTVRNKHASVERVFISAACPGSVLDYYSRLAVMLDWKAGDDSMRMFVNPLRAVYRHEEMMIAVTVAPDYEGRRSICTVSVTTPYVEQAASSVSRMKTLRMIHPYAKMVSFALQVSGDRQKEHITLRCSDPPAMFLATAAAGLTSAGWVEDVILKEMQKIAGGSRMRIFHKANTLLMIAAGGAGAEDWEYNIVMDSNKTRRR